MFITDCDGTILDCNWKAIEILNQPKEHLVGKAFINHCVNERDEEWVRDMFQSTIAGQMCGSMHVHLDSKTSAPDHTSLNISPKYDDAGAISGAVICCTDTSPKRSSDDLRGMANELRKLIDTTNAPIFGIDVDGVVNEWNQKAAELIGFSKEEVIGQQMPDQFISIQYRDAVKQVLDNALNGEDTANFEFGIYTKHGSYKVLLLNATTRRDADGQVTGVVAIGQDISERHQFEQKLSTMASDLQKLIDAVNAPIFGIDPCGFVNEWNFESAEITGFSKDEAQGRDFISDFIAPE